MAKSYDKNLLDLAIDYIQGSHDFRDILNKYNLLSSSEQGGENEIKIACPRHKDSTPSLGINLSKNKFNCLSCGWHGNIIDFISGYETHVLENRSLFTSVVERMLREDPVMQLRLGSSTIFKNNTSDDGLESLRIRRSVSFRDRNSDPKTFAELSRKLKSKYRGKIDVMLLAIDCKERGMSPEEIYSLVGSSSRNVFKNESLKSVDLASILGEDDD